jgi:hypothetical protein
MFEEQILTCLLKNHNKNFEKVFIKHKIGVKPSILFGFTPICVYMIRPMDEL